MQDLNSLMKSKEVLPAIRKIIYPPCYTRSNSSNSGDNLDALKSIYHDTFSKCSAHQTRAYHTTTLKSIVLTPPPTVQTPSPAPRRKRRRIQFVNYLDTDDDKPKRRSRRYRYVIKLSPTSILRIKRTSFTRSCDCSAVRHRNLKETKTSWYQPDD